MGVEEFRMAMSCSVVVIRFNPQLECENLDSTIGDEDIRQLTDLRNTLERDTTGDDQVAEDLRR